MNIITLKNINKSYKMGGNTLHVLKNINLVVKKGGVYCNTWGIWIRKIYLNEYNWVYGY